MKRLALLSMLALIGCRSSIDLSGGRAYACSRDGGVTGCTSGWLCGDDLRCYDPDVGVARACERAESGCGGGWKCGFDKVCFDPSVVDGPVRGCSDPSLHCPANWLCGFDNTCFDPEKVDGPQRACADPLTHCPRGWRCGLDRLCFDPAAAAPDGGARPCTEPTLHCAAGERCGLDGLCFDEVRASDGGVGASCELDRHCPRSWRCGIEASGRRRCQAVGVGGAYPCASDDDCEASWRCNPVARLCADVRDTLESNPATSMTFRLLGPLDAGGPVKAVSASPAGEAIIPEIGPDRTRFVNVVSLPEAGGLSLLHWTDQEPRSADGGAIVAARQLFPFDSSRVQTIAALPAEALVLTDAGTLLRFRFGSTGPDQLASGIVMVRPSLHDATVLSLRANAGSLELMRWGRDFDGGVMGIMQQAACNAGNGELVDLAWASDQGQLRMILLTTSGFCFAVMPPGLSPRTSPLWAAPPGSTPRRLRTNFHEGPGAFVEPPQPSPTRASGITNLVVEFTLADGGTGLVSTLLNDWNQMGLPTLSHISGSAIPLPCDNSCPGNAAPTEIVPIAPLRGREDRSFLARCPAVSTDAGLLPAATWTVTAGANECRAWRRTRELSLEEERPRRGPIVSDQTSTNRRTLMDERGNVWLPSSDGGVVPRGLQLDRSIDLAIRVFLAGQAPRLFLTAGPQQYAALDGLGVFAQADFPTSFTPIGSVSGAPTWVVTTGGVFDAARFPAGSELPFVVATPPNGTSFRLPSSAVERDDLLFVASQDAVSLGNVRRQKADSFSSPEPLSRAIVPTPGRDIRSLTATPSRDGGLPEAWSVTQGGVFKSSSRTGTNWITQQVPLGTRDGEATLIWASGDQVRLLLETGEVLSLPTAVPLAAPPVPSARVSSATRFCGTTWAIVDQGAGDGGLFALGATPTDGGLAPWVNLSPRIPIRGLSTSVLRPSSLELVITSQTGATWAVEPILDGGCVNVRD